MDEIRLDTIQQAVETIRNGKVIIVVDDEDRENEGDFVCAPITEKRCDELELGMMVGKNTAIHETPFTISVDLLGHGCTTGISAHDRFKTIKALAAPETKKEELGRPGHIFPLMARNEGVLRRAGHTEAAIDFARIAGFRPAGVLAEILNEDGTMARLPDLRKLADKFGLVLVSIKDL